MSATAAQRYYRRHSRASAVHLKHSERVIVELTRAYELHPHPWRNRWHALCVLGEEVWEVAKAVWKGDKNNLKQELAQVAAVCVRWLEWEENNAR